MNTKDNSKTYSTEAMCLDVAYKNAKNSITKQDISNHARAFVDSVYELSGPVILKNPDLISNIVLDSCDHMDYIDLSSFYDSHDYSSLLTIERSYNKGLRNKISHLLAFCESLEQDKESPELDTSSYAGHILGRIACYEELAYDSSKRISQFEELNSESVMGN